MDDSRARLRGRILAVMGVSGVSFVALVACGSGAAVGTESDAAADAPSDTSIADSNAPGTDAADASNDAPLSIRRPFLVGMSLRSALAARREDWSDAFTEPHGVDARTLRALAAAWLKDALEEHASIAAFSRFALHLLAVGAPPELIEDAQRAAVAEIGHARGCFGLARRYGASSCGPGALSLDDAMNRLTLAELAALTVQEGCVGETLGALLAEEQHRRAKDPEVKSFMRRVADDELLHAELAWRFAAWAIREGDADVKIAVRDAFASATRAATRFAIRPTDVDVDAWHAHGRVTCAEAREVAERGVREVIEPCVRALLDREGDAALVGARAQIALKIRANAVLT